MTIGIYSGSFDPIHYGHIRLADHIANSGLVDEVWMMVTPLNPLKADKNPPASDIDRLEMCRIATSAYPHLRADDTELFLPSPNYTYQTLSHLQEKYPNHNFKLIVGSDNIRIFNRWRNADKILSEFGVLVYPRPGELPEILPEGATMISDCTLFDISSTELRQAIATHQSIHHFTPPAVAQYISKHNLYR